LPAEDAPHAVAIGFGPNLLTVGLQRVVVGTLPAGMELRDHPLAIAGWLGLLITMLNLIPVGQLDGGHLAFAVLGSQARRLGLAMVAVMALLCLFFSAGWGVWLLVTSRLVGLGHPPVLLPEEPLSNGRRWVCAVSLLALLLCLIPVPLRQVMLP
jgi:membrane-associated protease RseP (regulator of RpoE activity)